MSMADRDGKIWMDGELVDWRDAKIHVLTHTLHYGCGAFEGVRAYDTVNGTAIFRLYEHTQRLFNSAKILRMKIPFSFDEVVEAQRTVVRENKLASCYLRPLTWIGSEKLGVSPKGNTVHLMVAAWPWGAYLGEEGMKRGIRVKTSSYTRHHVNITMTQAKTVSQLHQLDPGQHGGARRRLRRGAAARRERLRQRRRGREPLHRSRRASSTRPTSRPARSTASPATPILAICDDLGLKLVEKRITRDEVYICDEAFFTGTAAEVTPIRELDRIELGAGSRGPITEKIQSAFFDIVNGRNPQVRRMADQGLSADGRRRPADPREPRRRARRARAAGPGRRLLPESADAALEQPPARLHRRRYDRRRQVPVLRHRVPAEGRRDAARAH